MFHWGPTFLGKALTGSADWRLTLDGETITLNFGSRKYELTNDGSSHLKFHQGLLWTTLSFELAGNTNIKVGGMSHSSARHFRQAAAVVIEKQRLAKARKEREALLEDFRVCMSAVAYWGRHTVAKLEVFKIGRRWITTEDMNAMQGNRPSVKFSFKEMSEKIKDPELQALLSKEDRQSFLYALLLFDESVFSLDVASRNEKHTASELQACKEMFDTIEKMPLTEEQARAVICFDNRIQVVAAAGSGKTSTMVAKAAYAIERGLVAPENICMLAFNSAAAKELQTRINEGLEKIGRSDAKVTAMTFHKFGLSIIGNATNAKPRLASWVEQGKTTEKLSELIDDLKDLDKSFRTRWDLFRMVFSRDLPQFGVEPEFEDFDSQTRKMGYQTLKGEVVKSPAERTIANFLFYNGIDYKYERPYEHKTETAEHSQYHPDFYYPAVNLYHEHQALDKNGKPPEAFVGYMDKVIWAREQHAHFKTDCIETTSAQIWDGSAFDHLERELKQRGLEFDPNPDRDVPGQKPVDNADLVKLFRAFIVHAKSNCLSMDKLHQRIAKEPADAFVFRHKFFLDLLEPIWNAWNQALRVENAIDFEDMLTLAGEHLEAGDWESPYELVMVDEFQDASWARAKMCQALVRQPGRFLFAVGDDWQSINRFAGADISVMTGFEQWCGDAVIMKLQRTFRCPQSLCDASSEFVMQNPKQIAKEVKSETPAFGPVLQAYQVDDRDKIHVAIEQHLQTIYGHMVVGTHPPGRNGKVSVYMLGRYRNDAQYVPIEFHRNFGDRMTIEFRTIHTSKGSEADYVILPGMVRKGFPNGKEDDPILSLAMPADDAFPKSEERRLFYVALTRARRSVAMFTVKGKESPFLMELIKADRVELMGADGEPTAPNVCPRCGNGVLTQKSGRYGFFLSCTNFPPCTFSMNAPPAEASRRLN